MRWRTGPTCRSCRTLRERETPRFHATRFPNGPSCWGWGWGLRLVEIAILVVRRQDEWRSTSGGFAARVATIGREFPLPLLGAGSVVTSMIVLVGCSPRT